MKCLPPLSPSHSVPLLSHHLCHLRDILCNPSKYKYIFSIYTNGNRLYILFSPPCFFQLISWTLLLFSVLKAPSLKKRHPSIIWMYYNLFSYRPVERHLDCFQFFTITNNAAGKYLVNCHLHICPKDKSLELALLSQEVCAFVILIDATKLLPK